MSQSDLKIGPKIKAFRRQLGMQANRLAEKLKISASYLALIEGGKRKIDGDLLLKVCEELKIGLSDLTTKSDVNLANNISELLDDKLFENLDILGPEIKDLVNTNPKIARALIKLGDNYKQKDHELVNKVENLSGKMIDSRKTSFPGEVVSDFLQENKNYFPKLEEFANIIFGKIQTNKRTGYMSLCEFIKKEYSITVKDVIPEAVSIAQLPEHKGTDLEDSYTLSRDTLFPVIVEAIKELSDKLDIANTKIEALENE